MLLDLLTEFFLVLYFMAILSLLVLRFYLAPNIVILLPVSLLLCEAVVEFLNDSLCASWAFSLGRCGVRT